MMAQTEASRQISGKRLRGRHVAWIICTGFAVVIGVNLTMATLASRSHPGLVVENSYVASQNFNQWLADGRAQKALGWQVTPQADGALFYLDALDKDGVALTGLKGELRLSHPITATPPETYSLTDAGNGRYVSPALPKGNWIGEIRLQKGDAHFYHKQSVQIKG